MFSTLGAESDRKCASEASSPELTGPDDTMFSTLGAVSDRKCASEASSPEFTGPDDTMFSSPGAMSDIILVVEDKKLHVSKCVLGLASSVFLRMFEGDYKGRTEIPLVDKKYEDVVELLLCIYPSTNKPITEGNIHAVLPLADEYGIESLKSQSESFLLHLFQLREEKYHDPPNKDLVHLLYLADKYKLNKLLDVCVDKVKFRGFEGKNGVSSLSEFKLMSVDTKFRVASERLNQLEVPVKDVIRNAVLGVHISAITDPSCHGCKYSQCQHNTDLEMHCRISAQSSIRKLNTKLRELNIQFHKDPSLLQRYTPSVLSRLDFTTEVGFTKLS